MVYVLVKCYLAALLRMASVNVNGAGGVAGEGFVTAALLVLGVGMAVAGALVGANVQPLPVVGGNGDGATTNAGGARPPMRWTNNTSGFVLRRMRQLINLVLGQTRASNNRTLTR